MKQILLGIVLLYALWALGYLLYGCLFYRRRIRNTPLIRPSEASRNDDIVGKSHFTLSHSPPQATTALAAEKGMGNQNTFAPLNQEKSSAQVPDDELDETFSHTSEPNLPMDIDYPLEDDVEEQEGEDFTDEEDDETHLPPSAMLADGSSFEEMGQAIRTVVHHQTATQQQRLEAGEVLLDMKPTDLFEQVVQSAPGRGDIVTLLLDEFLSDFRSRQAEAAASGSRSPKAPSNFDIHDFV